MSNVAVRANLSYDRLIGYLNELGAAGMVEGERMPRLTAKGRAFLQEYRQWRGVLDRFGLHEPDMRGRRGNAPP